MEFVETLRGAIYAVMTPVSDFVWTYILFYLLFGAGVVFTVATRFMQFRMLGHMIRITFDSRSSDQGVSSFQALATSLAARVGTGNLAGVALALSGIGQPVALVAYAVCAFVATGIVHEWIRGTHSRHRRGDSYPVAFVRLISANRPRYGGYFVHMSIVMLAVGAIGSSFYDAQRDFALSTGEYASLAGYSFKYVSFDFLQFEDRDEFIATFDVWEDDNLIGTMKSTRSYYPDFEISATRAGIRSTVTEDLYIVPSEFGTDGQAVFRVYVNPLVWWMWASAPILVFGMLIAVSPSRRSKRAVVLTSVTGS